MNPLENESLDVKLAKIFRLAITFCLVVTTLGFSSVFFFYLSRSFLQELSAVTSVVGATSRASLVFKDSIAGVRVLSALDSEKEIVYGLLTAADGLPHAETGIKPELFVVPNKIREESVVWSLNSITVTQPIFLEKEYVGSISTVWSLDRIYYQGGLFILVALGVLIVATLGAYRFKKLLQNWVSKPLISLTDLVQDVSITKNFSSRLAESNSNDEVQRLIRSFNYMLEQIQERDQQIVLAKEKAEQADQMKSVFLATVSHELRTPLHAILGMTDEVLDSSLNTEQRELLSIVKNSGSLLISIINDILDFSKIEAGKLVLIASEIELPSFLEKVFKMFELSAKTKGISLKLSISPEVPLLVILDGARLAQILVNLIGNAVKFTHTGSIELSVIQRTDSKRPGFIRLQFLVSDTGIGISETNLKTIFESFSQVPRAGNFSEGTGLGLAISSRLVALMRGQIWAESSLGQGSQFSFWIEVGEVLHRAINQEGVLSEIPLRLPIEKQQISLLAEDEPTGDGPSILVVEDNPVNIKLAFRVLTKAGYRVLVAQNGQKCLDVLSKERVQLILMDIGMPVMDGLEATRQIRAIEKESNLTRTPIIALTANFSDDQGASCFEAGMDEFLTKPLESKKLLSSISRLLMP